MFEHNKTDETLKLEYPCQWVYKIIGKCEDCVKKAVDEIYGEKKYTISVSNNSRNGKYCSFNLELTVKSEEERNTIYTKLKNNVDIVMVL